MVRTDLFYRQADQMTIATIFNLTTPASRPRPACRALAVYTVASATGGFGTVTAPPGQFRVWAFIKSAATTYTGTRGTMTGAWNTSPIAPTPAAQGHRLCHRSCESGCQLRRLGPLTGPHDLIDR